MCMYVCMYICGGNGREINLYITFKLQMYSGYMYSSLGTTSIALNR